MLIRRLALAFASILWVASAYGQPLTTKPSLTDMLIANCNATRLIIGSAIGPACIGAPTRAGDIAYYNGTTWVTLAGNNSGTQFFTENASGVPSWATVAGTGTVTSVTCGTGLDGGTFTSSGTCSLSAARRTAQTIQKFLGASLSGTYTTPANVLSIDIVMVGAGGGGEGSGSGHGNGGTGGDSCWNTTGAACTTPVYKTGGGVGGTTTSGGGGGAVTGTGTCDFAFSGGSGQATNGALTVGVGGTGGASHLGGAGAGGAPGQGGFAGGATTGGGGGGAASNGTAGPGAGGGAGAICTVHISAPAATYTYATGAAGGVGSAGGGGTAGGAGGTPGIWVTENYNIN